MTKEHYLRNVLLGVMGTVVAVESEYDDDAPRPPEGWFRLVCRTCGYRFPEMTAVSSNPGCCGRPRLAIHADNYCPACTGPEGRDP